MTNTTKHPELERWLVANGKMPVYWTAMTNISNIERVTAALTDLHRMLRDDSNEDIIEFFSNIRQQIKQTDPLPDDDNEYYSRGWPQATD